MVNMAYCRFQNTLEALRECAEALAAAEDANNPLAGLSMSETQAARDLMDLCVEMVDDYLWI